ncbi:MAG: DUF6259 domain-containing protein [Lentisphaeria bacterium]|nr:DUF6259 domain-containing protein [Lentisphaeria bacterium]
MRRALPSLVLALALPAAAGLLDWGWQAPLDEPARWQHQPGWLTNPDGTATAARDGDALRFAVPAAGRGMKWSLPGVNAAIPDAPYLLLEYRARGVRTTSTDYFLYLDDGGKRETRAVQLDALVADGQWHTLVRDLREVAESPVFSAIAIQVQAAADSPAEVWIRNLRQVAEPPPELTAPAQPPAPDVRLPLATSEWVPRPGWLANPDETPAGTVAEDGVRLAVPTPGKGMKWSWFLPGETSLADHRFLAVRYRAAGLSGGGDYALCVLGTQSAAGRDYAAVLPPGTWRADGDWHLATVDLAAVAKESPRITGLAVQAQAQAPDATLEITEITLVSRLPAERASDWFGDTVPARAADLRPLPLPATGRATLDEVLAAAQVADWPAGRRVRHGIPFDLPGAQTPVPATGFAERADAELPVGQACSQVFALVFALLRGAEEEVYARNGKLTEIREIDRFRARLEYADGSSEACQPWNLTHRDFLLRDGAQVLTFFADPDKTLARIVLVDNSPGLALAVAALTACSGPVLIPDPDDALPLFARHPLQRESMKPSAHRQGDTLNLRLPLGTVTLALTPLPRLKTMRNLVAGDELLRSADPGEPLFRVRVDGQPVPPENFRLAEAKVHDTPTTTQTRLRYTCREPLPLTLAMDIIPSLESEILFANLRLTNDGGDSRRLAVEGPFAGPFQLGANPADVHYLHPREGACLHQRETYRRDRFGGRFPLQFMVAFNPVANSGVYLRTEGGTEMRDYALAKNAAGVSFAVHYPADLPVAPGEAAVLSNAALGLSEGDWHRAYQAYRHWLAAQYRPLSQKESWFREVFNFRQRFLHAHDPLYDQTTGKYRLENAIAEGEEHFGGIEYLHLFDWGNVPGIGRTYGRTGDVSPFEETLAGGTAAFRDAIQAVRRRGVRVGLYIEGYLLEERGQLGAAHGAEWQIVQRNGERLYWPNGSEMMICPAVPAWREVQLSTYEARVRELEVDGMYLDQFGFANEGKDCWSDAHGHPVPLGATASEFAFTKLMRQRLSSVRPDVVLYGEEVPGDVNSQNMDGAFSYHMATCRQTRPLVPLNLPRFAYPSFKTFEILVCDRPMGGWTEGVQWTFFNGSGIWLEGPAATWFRPETLATIRHCHAILRDHRDAFTSRNVEPLVDTGVPGVFANVFRHGPKTVYTLYNARHRTFRGSIAGPRWQSLLRVEDVWNRREVVPEPDGLLSRLPVELPPRGVGCLLLVQ